MNSKITVSVVALVVVGAVFFMNRDSSAPYDVSPDTTGDQDDLIRVSVPTPNDVIVSPLSISGEARGAWFFEASFPVELRDADGVVLAQVSAQAIGEWMTTAFVPFSATMTFTKPVSATGTLILRKDNPSGLPEFDDSILIPVWFE